MLGYNRQREFAVMINAVAKDIVDEFKGDPIPIAYSGGIDSTVVLLALLRHTNNIVVCHLQADNSKYSRMLNAVADGFCKKYGLVKKNIPWTIEFYPGFIQKGIKKFVFSDGFDIAYNQIYEEFQSGEYPYGKSFKFSYGERFRSAHRYIDVFMHLPSRIKAIRASKGFSGSDRLMSSYYNELKYEKRAQYDVDVIDFDCHPFFMDFFSRHYARYLDVFYRKYYNEWYIKNISGKSFMSLVKEICYEHNLRFSFSELLFKEVKCCGVCGTELTRKGKCAYCEHLALISTSIKDM